MVVIVQAKVGYGVDRYGEVVVDIGDGVGVLIPHCPRGGPGLFDVAQCAHCTPCESVVADDNLGLVIAIYIRDGGVVVHRRRGVLGREKLDLAGKPIEDDHFLFIDVDHFRDAIALKVEDAGPGRTGLIDDARGPLNLAFVRQGPQLGAASHDDFRVAVTVDIADRCGRGDVG